MQPRGNSVPNRMKLNRAYRSIHDVFFMFYAEFYSCDNNSSI